MLPQTIDYYDVPIWLNQMYWRRIAAEMPLIHAAFIRQQYSSLLKSENLKMLKTYQFADDESKLIAETALEVVTFMRDNSKFASGESIGFYMNGFSDRFALQAGDVIRFDTPENFVADLLKFDFLVEVATEMPPIFI
jgi:hypothetical protein